MRTTKALVLAMAAGGAALVASRGDLSASGEIDVSDATITIGDAPVRGTLTTDESASLGNKPNLTPPDWSGGYGIVELQNSPAGSYLASQSRAHAGLGGTTFRAQVDLTYPGGTYDYDSFTVDQGVTVRFTGPTTLRATNAMRIDGRVEMAGAGVLLLDCTGDVTIVGHDDAVATGLFADDDGASIVLTVGGNLDVSADAGTRAHFHATGPGVNGRYGGSVGVFRDRSVVGAAPSTSIADADFEAAPDGAILVDVVDGYVVAAPDGEEPVITADGPLTLTNCTTSGPVAKVVVLQLEYGYVEGMDAVDSLVVSGGTYAGLLLETRRGIRVTDGAVVAGGAEAGVSSHQGSVRVVGGSSLEAGRRILIAGNGVEIGEDCVVRTTDDTPGAAETMQIIAYYRDPITVGLGAVVESQSNLYMRSVRGVTVAGTVRAYGDWADLRSAGGDVSIADGADVDAPNGTLRLLAAGAVTAVGGTATLTAREYDVRCATGDLDLDVATMDATAGRIVAMSSGPVRLRGTYRATGDVQVISLADSIDVHGATLSTNDAGASPSGFVRLETYAATTIDAGESTITTGDSDAQSGDVLIQTQDGGSAVSSAAMRVARVTARRTPDGVMTRIQGTISAAALRTTDFSGSARVTAGELSKRIFLQGLTGRIEGTSGSVSVKLIRVGKTHVRFVIDIREPSATAGERKTLRFARAGFHAAGRFKRPKAR